MGQAEEGLKETNRGIAWYQGLRTPPIFWPLLLMIRAEMCGNAGRAAEGLSLLDEALGIVGGGSEFVLSAEILRLKGEPEAT